MTIHCLYSSLMLCRYTEFGGPVPWPAEDLAFSVARFIQKGGSFVNYYTVISLFIDFVVQCVGSPFLDIKLCPFVLLISREFLSSWVSHVARECWLQKISSYWRTSCSTHSVFLVSRIMFVICACSLSLQNNIYSLYFILICEMYTQNAAIFQSPHLNYSLSFISRVIARMMCTFVFPISSPPSFQVCLLNQFIS